MYLYTYTFMYKYIYLKVDASAAGPKWIGSSIFSRLFFCLFVNLIFWAFFFNWFDICQIMLRYWLQFGEKSRSGGILGGLGDLSEAMLKMACLGSCWSYVGTSLAAGWLPRSSFRRLRMPKWTKMGGKGLQNWAKMASWARNSKLLLQFWCHFSCFLVDYLHIKKPQKSFSFQKFFEGLGVQYGPKIEENSLKMAILSPR